jgi:DNA-directed RNA polymerase specialized sigma24 family protein
MVDEDVILLNLYRHGEEKALRLLIDRHQKKIFALVLYLMGGSSDQAREITVSSFLEALQGTYSQSSVNSFFLALVRRALRLSFSSQALPLPGTTGLTPRFPEEKEAIGLVRRALLSLSFDAKAKVLLRDQLHLRHEDIASVLGSSVQTNRAEVRRARNELQDKIQELLNPPR